MASRGVRIGLRDVHYALLETDNNEVGATYQEPAALIGAITANINPNASTETLFADDGPMEVASTLGNIELELTMADLPLDVQAVLLGHTWDDVAKQLIRKSEDTPPWLAVGFRALKSNGEYRYVWLLKGKFMVPEEGHETRGETIEFQTPTITGAFTKRDFDDKYQILGDSDVEDFVSAEWFTTTTLDNIEGTEGEEGGEEGEG